MEATNYEVSYVSVCVKDIVIAREFYEDILGMPMIVDCSEDGYFLLSLGCTTLIVETANPEEKNLSSGRYLGISLKAGDIMKTYKTLEKQGVKFSNIPEKQFWGGYLTEFSDLDGNIWTLLE